MTIQWLKSSFSEQPHGDCIELAAYGGEILIRESDDPEVVVCTTRTRVRALLESVKSGGLHLPQ